MPNNLIHILINSDYCYAAILIAIVSLFFIKWKKQYIVCSFHCNIIAYTVIREIKHIQHVKAQKI